MSSLKKFYLDEYIAEKFGIEEKQNKIIDITKNKKARFDEICRTVKEHFNAEWDIENNNKNYEILLERQRKAIIGYEKEVKYFKTKIYEYLKDNNLLDEWHPSWYKNIVDAIFEENWGLAGISEWKHGHRKELIESSSAKIIGDRIYFLINGKMTLQPQRISKKRRNQLRRALLLKTPKKRLDDKYHEVFMLDGTRITIYGEDYTLDGQDVIVFRKYILPNLTFEEQAKRNTIPFDSIPLFKSMVKLGFNVGFIGAVRSGKSTFLATFQRYENPELEGVLIQSDPEIKIHNLMPNAPIISLLIESEELDNVIRSILRSDADYIIVAEAREPSEFYLALEVTDRGTRRSKLTAHFTRAVDFCYNVANKINSRYSDNLYSTIIKVAQNFHYLFEFTQLKDKSKKRLKSIYEIRYNPLNQQISYHQICKYRYETDDWVFKYDIGEDKENIAKEEDIEAFNIFKSELKRLAEKYPMKENNIFIPDYDYLRRGI